ncbi:MAG: hypothetical protein SWI22_07370 [Pseudomonadota bacterium]|nr:hypothetical protein [Pseudomonadota bacterium]
MITAPLLASLALAMAPPVVQDPVTDLSDVVVLGSRRDEAAAERFVSGVAAPPFGVSGLAIWDRPICLVVDNLRPATASAIRDRVAQRARSVGVEMADGDCRMNVLVVATADGRMTARSLVEEDIGAFRPAGELTNLDQRALRRFTDGDDPVRWWTVSLPVDVFTRRPLVARRGSSQPVQRKTPAYAYWGGSIRQVMASVVVVIDASKTGETPLEALADYIAFVVLAQVDATSTFDDSATILNLFRGGPSAAELTAWDQAYLTALYETPVTWTSVSRHRREIARRMITGTSDRAD